MIYWFTGASIQAVTTGAYRAVEFIKANIKLDGRREGVGRGLARRSSRSARSTRRRGCSTSSWRCSSRRSAFAFLEPYFFIGYLISIALFGLFQAIFMANAGGAWDNAKKIVEVELKEKGTPLHAATVVGDTVGDPFKDTSSVALNPIIKFTTLFGLLAVELAVQLAQRVRRDDEPPAGGGVPRRVGVLRVAVVLRDADPERPRLTRAESIAAVEPMAICVKPVSKASEDFVDTCFCALTIIRGLAPPRMTGLGGLSRAA